MSLDVRMSHIKATLRQMSKSPIIKFLIAGVVLLCLYLVLPTSAYAASVEVDILPEKNPVAVGQEAFVDIFLNTGTNSVTLTRVVLTYDPNFIEVTSAKHGDIFCEYPDTGTDYIVDNDSGLIKITGFCEKAPFNSNNDFDLFAKVGFTPKKSGKTTISAEYSQAGGVDVTAVFDDKSPPQNILTTQPSIIVLGIGNSTGDLPSSGIADSGVIWVGVGLLGVGGFVYYAIKNRSKKSK